MRRLVCVAFGFVGCVVLAGSPQAEKKDKVDAVTKDQRAVVVKAVRERLQSRFKDKWSDEERAALVEKAKDNPAQFLPQISGDPKKGDFGCFAARGEKSSWHVVKIVNEEELVASLRGGANIGSGFQPKGGSGRTFFYFDIPTKDLKVDSPLDTKPLSQVHYITGEKTVDGKKAWRAVRIEFTDDEKAAFAPKPAKKK